MKKYNHELDHENPSLLGKALCRSGKAWSDETDPTYEYEYTDFLIAFRDAMEKAYYRERDVMKKEAHIAAVPAFIASLPPVGTHVWVEFPNNPEQRFPCVIEFIGKSGTHVLIRLTNIDELDPTSSPYRLLGYEYPGRFPVFHKDPA